MKPCIVAVKTTCRAIADAVVLNCESFTRCSHAHLDNNSFAHGEPGAKKALAGVAAGTGIAVLAVNVLSWLWGVYLRSAVYGTDGLFDVYKLPLLFGLLSLVIQLPFSIASIAMPEIYPQRMHVLRRA